MAIVIDDALYFILRLIFDSVTAILAFTFALIKGYFQALYGLFPFHSAPRLFMLFILWFLTIVLFFGLFGGLGIRGQTGEGHGTIDIGSGVVRETTSSNETNETAQGTYVVSGGVKYPPCYFNSNYAGFYNPDCYNGREDGPETGVDCGGPCESCDCLNCEAIPGGNMLCNI